MCFKTWIWCSLTHECLKRDFQVLIYGLYGLGQFFLSIILRILDKNIMVYFIDFEFPNVLLKLGCFADLMVDPNCAVLLQWLLLKIMSVRILETAYVGAFLWLFSPALDAFELTLKVGFIYSFEVTGHWPYLLRSYYCCCPGIELDTYLFY